MSPLHAVMNARKIDRFLRASESLWRENLAAAIKQRDFPSPLRSPREERLSPPVRSRR